MAREWPVSEADNTRIKVGLHFMATGVLQWGQLTAGRLTRPLWVLATGQVATGDVDAGRDRRGHGLHAHKTNLPRRSQP
jgi:hypothetical protein